MNSRKRTGRDIIIQLILTNSQIIEVITLYILLFEDVTDIATLVCDSDFTRF